MMLLLRYDRNVIEGLSATRINHEDNVTRVLKGDRERASQTLIRDADSRKSKDRR